MNAAIRWRPAIVSPVAVATGIVVLAVVNGVARTVFVGLGQGPLSIALGYPAGLALGVGTILVVYRALAADPRRSASGIAIGIGGLSYLLLGGLVGVGLDIADGPSSDLVRTVILGVIGAVVITVGTYARLSPSSHLRQDGNRRRIAAAVAAIAAGLSVASGLFVGLTELLNRYVWLSVFYSGPIAVVAGLGAAVLVYRSATGEPHPGVVASIAGILAGGGVSVLLFVGVLEVVGRYVSVSVFHSGTVAMAAGLGVALLVYRRVDRDPSVALDE